MKPNRSTCFLSQEEFEKIRAKYAKFNEPWSLDEEKELREMAADSQPINTMAEQLQRTPNSVRMKLKALGILKPRPTVWTEEDDSYLIDAYECDIPFEDISRRLNRSVKALVNRLVHLRIHLFDQMERDEKMELSNSFKDNAQPGGEPGKDLEKYEEILA